MTSLPWPPLTAVDTSFTT